MGASQSSRLPSANESDLQSRKVRKVYQDKLMNECIDNIKESAARGSTNTLCSWYLSEQFLGLLSEKKYTVELATIENGHYYDSQMYRVSWENAADGNNKEPQ
tara:strand:- start:445 stop:753 length:309 start_codon:yes stop_codon:yes gene_type:complete